MKNENRKMGNILVCSLDEQQCQQECEHKNDRTKCPFTEVKEVKVNKYRYGETEPFYLRD